jgi:hypothetical protein
MNRHTRKRALLLAAAMVIIITASTRLNADTGMCGGANITLPFTDVSSSNIFFCSIAEAFFSGLTNGTTPTTYSPAANVPREQMAAFVTRTLDQSVKRAGRRAALDQYWTTQTENNLGLTTVGNGPGLVKFDGADVWVANFGSGTVSRVRASDGRVLDSPPGWTGATGALGVLTAMGKVFITGQSNPGKLYSIDPSQAPGPVTLVTAGLGASTIGIAFDGQRIWTANLGSPGSVSIVTLNPTTVTTVTAGFSGPTGLVYDGANMWVTDGGDQMLKKLDSSGNIIMPSVPVGNGPSHPAFDGTNIWVPNGNSASVTVVRAVGQLAGTVLATLSGNGLNTPTQIAFDGERMLVTNQSGNSVSLWRASDLSPIGTFPTGGGTGPFGACSDGLNFWVTLGATNKVARF